MRQVEEPSSRCGVHYSDAGCLKHAKVHHQHCSVVLTCYVPPARKESSPGVRESVLRSGEGNVSTLKDSGVDISKNTQVDRAVLEVHASAGRGITVLRRAGRIRHIATSPTLWVQKLTQDDKLKTAKIPGVSNPADLGTKHLDGGSIQRHWRDVTVTFAKEGLVSHCGQSCKKPRDTILKLSLSMVHTKLTRDGESSDAGKLKQLRNQTV